MMRWMAVVLVAAQCLQMVLAAKILALCTVTSRSHSLWCYRYMAVLDEQGHQITVLGLDKPKIKVPNMKTFIADGVYEAVHSQENIKVYKAMSQSIIHTLDGILLWLRVASETVLHSKALRDLIDQHEGIEKPFDLIIHDGASCAGSILGLLPLFGNPPLVLATTYGFSQWMAFRIGNIFNPAYVTNMLINLKPDMDFCERFLNTFYYVVTEWFIHFRFEWHQENLKREVFGEGLPHVRDLAKRASVVIMNYNLAFDQSRPVLPGTVGIAGLHIQEPQPLPQDIKEFMDGAKHGVILFSFGSNVDSTWFAEDFQSKVIKAFEQIPQRVIWKWDKTPMKIPPNVKIGKWLPQADILAHPQMRLFATLCGLLSTQEAFFRKVPLLALPVFIDQLVVQEMMRLFATHCGLLSTQEAFFRKVPLLALPVFIDQLDNAALLVRRNLTIQLDVHTLTTTQLRDGIREILENPMYKNNIVELGSLMQDLPLTAKQQAVYWTEYAIRHSGAAHLRSAAADMPWYQLLLLDVIGLLVVVALISLWLIKTGLSFVIRKLLRIKIKNKSE